MNPRGVLRFTTSAPGSVTARVFDLSGRLVRTITAAGSLEAGDHTLVIDGRDDRGATLATGVYFYRIDTPDGVSRGRFVVAK
jgi:flagellar hook assembly protein FlgD